MFAGTSCSESLVAGFERFASLDKTALDLINSLQIERREIAASTYIVREGSRPTRCAFLLEGFTFRQKLSAYGERAIVSLQVPGDFIDAQNMFLNESDHDVVALTRVEIADINLDDLRRLAMENMTIGVALWRSGLVEASIFREWLLNIGRRDAHQRVAHLLCEISARLEAAGLARELTYELPMTQEQLGDTLGLTAVHINRVLKSLEGRRLIHRQRREISITDWQGLRRLADFNERYLHLNPSS